jgi:hypothetical protein
VFEKIFEIAPLRYDVNIKDEAEEEQQVECENQGSLLNRPGNVCPVCGVVM